eukprot:1644723-Pyramimonas_sp.AAC.1
MHRALAGLPKPPLGEKKGEASAGKPRPPCEDPVGDIVEDLEGCSQAELATVYLTFCAEHPEYESEAMRTL